MPVYYRNEYLFSEIYLQEITQLPGNEEALASLNTLREYREYADTSSLATWKKSYVHEVLFALGFNVKAEEDNLTLLYPMGQTGEPIAICYVLLPDENLGNTTMGRNWAEKTIRSLKTHQFAWGLLTNGEQWRIYHLDESTPYETYLEMDLANILADKARQAYQVFFKFMKAENFASGADGKCRFDQFKKDSQDKIDYIEKELAKALKQKEEGGEGVLSSLCMGYVEFLRANGNPDLEDEALRCKIYHGAMLYMFRLLFLLYANARDLLGTENQRRLVNILSESEAISQKQAAASDRFSLWKQLQTIFVDIDQTYNGGLFSPQESEFTVFIEDTRIANDYLAQAIYHLSNYQEKSGETQPISYRDMSVRHLGTLYEGLLEHKLFITKEDTEVRISKGKIQFIPTSQGGKIISGHYIPAGRIYFGSDPSERKSSGSYFTPEDVVNYIVQQTVGRKLSEVFQQFITGQKDVIRTYNHEQSVSEKLALAGLIEDAFLGFIHGQILRLSVLDPAMGSGHFLVNTANVIANSITELLNDIDVIGSIETGTGFWRRRVVESCIYGVDLNPLAVELAKLSLWILSMTGEQPLSFLNHHLKLGDSLTGAWLDDVGIYPKNKKDGTESGEQMSIFASDKKFKDDVSKVIETYRLIQNKKSESLVDIQTKKGWLETIDQLLVRYKAIGSFHLDTCITGNSDEWTYQEIIKGQKDKQIGEVKQNDYFHWELEFPDMLIGTDHGFDIIIGNPPYVRRTPNNIQQRYFESANGSNLYVWFIELSMKLSKSNGIVGMIVPLSLMISSQMSSIRKLFLENKGHYRFANFDNIPDCIFSGGKESDNSNRMNSQRTTIAFIHKGFANKKIETTDFLRWQSSERPVLFQRLVYADTTRLCKSQSFPMIGEQSLATFMERFMASRGKIHDLTDSQRRVFKLYIPSTARYFIPASPEDLNRNIQSTLSFSDILNFKYAFILISSNIFYWYWRVYGDGFHVTLHDVLEFPLPTQNPDINELETLSAVLESIILQCKVYKLNAGIMVPNLNFNKRMDVLLKIDDWIMKKVAPDLNLPAYVFAQRKSNSFMQEYKFSLETNEDV